MNEDKQTEHHEISAKNRVEKYLGCVIEEASKQALREMNETLTQQLKVAVKRANAGHKLIEETSASDASLLVRSKKYLLELIHGEGYIETETERRKKIVVSLEEEIEVLRNLM